MPILFFFGFIPYFLLVYLSSLAFGEQKPSKSSLLKGSLIGYGSFIVIISVAFLIYESNESYWHYGPSWRFDSLFLLTALASAWPLCFSPFLMDEHFLGKK